MNFFSSRYMLRLYYKTSPFYNFGFSILSKYRWSHNRSLSTREIPFELLKNAGVRSYLDKLVSEEYSNKMSKPNVVSLISTIRSLKYDLQSLNDFNTGQYNMLFIFQSYLLSI